MTTTEKTDDRQDDAVPDAEAIQKVIRIVTSATIAKRPMLPTSPLEYRLQRVEQWFFAHAIHAAIVMFVTALLAIYSNSRPGADAALALAVLAVLLAFGVLVSGIVSGTLFFLQVRKSPYGPFLSLVNSSAHHDLEYVRELHGCAREAVQYVLVQYRQERIAHERRSGTLAGAIDKIGLFPALAGLVLLVSNLLKVPGPTAWGSFFGPLLLAFYFMSIATVQMTQQMDRVIALLEFSIQSRK